MKRIVIVAMVAVSTAVQAQRLVDLMKPVPAAITNEAAMPEQMARKFARQPFD